MKTVLNEIDSGFRYRLQFLIKEKNITYRELCYYLRIGNGTLKKWLDGKSYPYEEKQIDMICCKFKVNKNWLMRGYK